MGRKKRTKKKTRSRTSTFSIKKVPQIGKAPAHSKLKNGLVHIFVDDQNLFWGIVNREMGIDYRIDFGKLIDEVSRDPAGKLRPVKSAFIAGVIPDDDSFWEVAKNQGFNVKRGYLGTSNRSKQDDAYLITEIMTTLYEEEGPSTIILAAGDADYVPPLIRCLEKGWRNEVAFISTGVSSSLVPVVHQFRVLNPGNIRYEGAGMRFI